MAIQFDEYKYQNSWIGTLRVEKKHDRYHCIQDYSFIDEYGATKFKVVSANFPYQEEEQEPEKCLRCDATPWRLNQSLYFRTKEGVDVARLRVYKIEHEKYVTYFYLENI